MSGIDLQKIQALLNSATNPRQRQMYQTLLDKARTELAKKATSARSQPKLESKIESEPKPQTQQNTRPLNPKKSRAKAPKSQRLIAVEKPQASSTKAKVKQTKQTNSPPPKAIAIKETKRDLQALKSFDVPTALTESAGKSVETKKPPKIFQAVGQLMVTPRLEDNKVLVTRGDRDFEIVKTFQRFSQQFEKLKDSLATEDPTKKLLRVYPQILHDSKKNEVHHWFTLVRVLQRQTNSAPAESGLNEEEFVFRGIWQQIRYCDKPVILICRNIDLLKYYLSLPIKAKLAFARPQAFPVVWDAPVKPFVYNPELTQDEQMPRYFVQVKAVFDDGQYRVVEMLEEPTLKVPKYVRPVKKQQLD